MHTDLTDYPTVSAEEETGLLRYVDGKAYVYTGKYYCATQLLISYRERLAYLREQQARLGMAVPNSVVLNIRELQDEIAALKRLLAAWGVEIEDLPGDTGDEPSSHLPADVHDIAKVVGGSDTEGSERKGEERAQVRELLRTYGGRLHLLELQQAQKGINTPPEVTTEIEDIRHQINQLQRELGQLTLPTDRAALRSQRTEALTAYYAKKWELAEELLDQVVRANPDDDEAHQNLQLVGTELNKRADYLALRPLRDDGSWQSMLEALDDLTRKYTHFADPEGYREWAEYRKRRSERYTAVVVSLEALINDDPGDAMARTMLAQARQARDEGR